MASNTSHQLTFSSDLVVNVKWVLEGVIMPVVGSVGTLGRSELSFGIMALSLSLTIKLAMTFSMALNLTLELPAIGYATVFVFCYDIIYDIF